MTFESNIRPIEWTGSFVKLVDQTVIPYEYKTVDINTYQEMAVAIKDMIVRGAPAIGVSGAFGVALGAKTLSDCQNKDEFLVKLKEICEYLKSTRPTAVNLAWAVDIQYKLAETSSESVESIIKALTDNAVKILEDDIEINKKIGEYGAAIVPEGATIQTHCNAGALATAGYGTALGVIRSAYAKDNTIRVFADETRPRQQGARLTTWELVEDKIPTTLITDGMCGYFMKQGMIDVVIVGADRIAANGDTANKIGTYTVAIAAKAHNVPFYIAAPHSTIDMSIASGEEIPIEERDREEVTHINGKIICAEGVNIINPGFDVTPAEYITGIITESGIYKPSELKNIKF
jgi:methylthioribose-1-phosphate isomerase